MYGKLPDGTGTSLPEERHERFSSGRDGTIALLAETQLADQLAVPVNVRFLEILKELAALVDQPQEALPGMMILGVCLEVFGEIGDARGQ